MKEHHVFFSLTSPALLRGVPVGFAMWGFVALGMVWIYGGLFFNILWIRIATPVFGFVVYLVALKLTKDDIFWFTQLRQNMVFFRSLKFLKRKIKYRA